MADGRLDKAAAYALELYMDNDYAIQKQRVEPIRKNLEKKIAKGVFDPGRSVDLWMYAVEDAAKKYFKEEVQAVYSDARARGRWNDMFPRSTRLVVAKRAALSFMEDMGLPVSKAQWAEVSLED